MQIEFENMEYLKTTKFEATNYFASGQDAFPPSSPLNDYHQSDETCIFVTSYTMSSREPPANAESSGSQSQNRPLPDHVTAEVDPNTGKTFYLDHQTKTSSWLHPDEKAFTKGLPWPWERVFDGKNRAFYLNHEKKSSSWLDPVQNEIFKRDGTLEGNIYQDVPNGDCVLEEKTSDGKVYYVNYSKGEVGGPDTQVL